MSGLSLLTVSNSTDVIFLSSLYQTVEYPAGNEKIPLPSVLNHFPSSTLGSTKVFISHQHQQTTLFTDHQTNKLWIIQIWNAFEIFTSLLFSENPFCYSWLVDWVNHLSHKAFKWV